MLTAYTTPVARCLEKAGVPVILVGDTVGMVEMGFDSTRHVTLEHMRYHIGVVRRGAAHTHIIGACRTTAIVIRRPRCKAHDCCWRRAPTA